MPVSYQFRRAVEAVIRGKTKRIPLMPVYDRRTAAPVTFAVDAHGTYNLVVHIDEPDANANYKVIQYLPVVLPADYVAGTVTWNLAVLSSAAGGNNVFGFSAWKFLDNGTLTQLLSSTDIMAANASANTMTYYSKAFTTNPVAGDVLCFEFSMITNHASDSNTGTRALYAAWLQYTSGF